MTVLATSRELLGVDGETVWRLEPLEEVAAIQLFIDRARAQRAEVNVEDADTVRQVCVALDCIPLAIELAAARVALLTPGEILRLLNEARILAERLDPATLAAVEYQLTIAAFTEEDTVQAVAHLERGLATLTRLGQERGILPIHVGFGWALDDRHSAGAADFGPGDVAARRSTCSSGRAAAGRAGCRRWSGDGRTRRRPFAARLVGSITQLRTALGQRLGNEQAWRAWQAGEAMSLHANVALALDVEGRLEDATG